MSRSAIANLGKWLLPRRPPSGVDPTPYRPFARQYDRIVRAEDLDSALGRIKPRQEKDLDTAWKAFDGGWIAWRTKATTAGLEASERIRTAVDDTTLRDTVCAILIDQSGSMRGQNMLLAAMAADVARNFLVQLGVKAEVLGFTTTSWRGGKSRNAWKWAGRPRTPGRLCDLLHIIYSDADDERPGSGGWAFRPMLRPDLPKENVDGEAIEWAASRLDARQESRKLMLVVSDGAPVDDSTLKENGLTYLSDHLASVVANLEDSFGLGEVKLGEEAASPFQRSVTVHTPTDIATLMLGLLEKLLISQPAEAPWSATSQ